MTRWHCIKIIFVLLTLLCLPYKVRNKVIDEIWEKIREDVKDII